MQDVDRSEPLAGRDTIPFERALAFHVVVGAIVVLVCVVAALFAAGGYEMLSRIAEYDEVSVPTPYFKPLAAMVGVLLGMVSSIWWCSRVLANLRNRSPRFKPTKFAVVVAMGATLVLHVVLATSQAYLRDDRIHWAEAAWLLAMFGLLSGAVSGTVAGGIAYHWVAAYILGLDET